MKPQDYSAPHDNDTPQAPAGFALRILRGWHAGAQVALPVRGPLRVGGGDSADDCDIVLTDDAVAHAVLLVELVLQGDGGGIAGWRLHRRASPADADADGDDALLPFDAPVHIGALTLTVSAADAPWPAVSLPDDGAATAPDADPALAAAARTPDDARSPATQTDTLDDGTSDPVAATHDANHDARSDASGAMHPDPDASYDAAVAMAPHGTAHAGTTVGSTTDGGQGHAAKAGWIALRQRLQNGVPTRWLLAAGAVAIAAALVALFFILPGTTPAPPQAAVPTTGQWLAQVEQALRGGGWVDGIHAEQDAQGNVTVAGWVADDAARDRLSALLARLSPMPAMRIDIAADALQAARDAVRPFGPYLTADMPVPGQLRLRGIALPSVDMATAPDPVDPVDRSDQADAAKQPDATGRTEGDRLPTRLRAALRDAVAAAIPNATLDDVAVLSGDSAPRALARALADADLPHLSVHWDQEAAGTRTGNAAQGPQQLVIDAPAGTDPARLQRAVDAFRQRYGDRIPLRTLIGGSRAAFTPALLPFSIVSISSGTLPSVVVDGNVRLLPGGSYRGFRLRSVDDATVVFDRETPPEDRTHPAMQPPTRQPSSRIVLQR